MELKVGQTITCKKERHLSKSQCTTIGREYEVVENKEGGITIIDDEGEVHVFSLFRNSFAEYVFDYFTTEPPKKERYFIVFYNLKDSGYNHSVHFSHGEYPNKQKIETIISNVSSDLIVGITNIIELSKTDFESWNK